jgi:hypothetical protein
LTSTGIKVVREAYLRRRIAQAPVRWPRESFDLDVRFPITRPHLASSSDNGGHTVH